MNRRNFLHKCSIASAAACFPAAASVSKHHSAYVKPVVGSWLGFKHPNLVGAKHWNPALSKFTAEQWKTMIFDMHEIGFEYLVLKAVAFDGKAFYPSKLQPMHDFVCKDPLEAVLSAADECGIKFFIGNDFWYGWSGVEKIMKEEDGWSIREKGMEETAQKYAHHKSFYGWYYPNESYLSPLFNDVSVEYINRCSKIARSLTPNALTMVAPYGTQNAKMNDAYIRQLEQLDVHIIAYQDEVGVKKVQVGEAGKYFEALYKMHTKAGRSRLWADVEIFDYEGEVYRSPGIPTTFERMLQQITDVSPYVEHILIYQYQGFMNKPGTIAFAGHKSSEKLYTDYVHWLRNEK